MSFLSDFTAKLPSMSKAPVAEYFFALNIGPQKLSAALWSVEHGRLKITASASDSYDSLDEIIPITDKLLDVVLSDLEVEPNKILFGVMDSWLTDDDLKDDYLKILRKLVKELELTPMAYVATSHALSHFLEKQNSTPTTAVLVGIDKKFVTVTQLRAGKVDSSVVVERGSNLGADIEKGILSGVRTDVLPSKILIYGDGNIEKQKNELTSFPWMSKLSFLHFPKIEVLPSKTDLKAICLAGAVEIDPNVKIDHLVVPPDKLVSENEDLLTDAPLIKINPNKKNVMEKAGDLDEGVEDTKKAKSLEKKDLGFIAGDVTDNPLPDEEIENEIVDQPKKSTANPDHDNITDEFDSEELEQEMPAIQQSSSLDMEDEEVEEKQLSRRSSGVLTTDSPEAKHPKLSKFPFPMGNGIKFLVMIVLLLLALGGGYVFLPKAEIKVYVDPKILENEATIIADPTITEIDEAGKKIPGEIVEVQVTGSSKGAATGRKQVGDPAKGVVLIYNKTDAPKTLPRDTVLTSGNLKFTLDNSVTVASQSAVEDGITFGKSKIEVTAQSIGPDSNLPSGTELVISGFGESQFSAKAEGNFSGGTSKDVTVVTDADQKKLLATLTSELRQKAQEELQAKLSSEGGNNKKIVAEALSEEVIKKTYNKNINDQASEFTLNLTVKYKGTAFSDDQLKQIVAKLVETNVDEGFTLDLSESETQANVSKVEKDGKVVFAAKFKAKLIPKIDTNDLRKKLIGKTPAQAAEILKTYNHIISSDIAITPSLPAMMQRLPFVENNITLDVGLK